MAWPVPEPGPGPGFGAPRAAPAVVGTPWPRSDTHPDQDAVGDAGPATRAARPAVGPATAPSARGAGPGPDLMAAGPWPTGPAGPAPRSVLDDPPTDPRGFRPVPPASPAPIDPAEAGALAAAFAVDYLSWDEDDPGRRCRVLLGYLSGPGRDPARLGWSGTGRQRAEFALPGRARPDGDARLIVDVRVRITPYRAVGDHLPGDDREPPPTGTSRAPVCVPAAAPAPTGRGWRSLASVWVRLSVPVVHDGRRVVVDAREETFSEQPPRGTATAGPGWGPDQPVFADAEADPDVTDAIPTGPDPVPADPLITDRPTSDPLSSDPLSSDGVPIDTVSTAVPTDSGASAGPVGGPGPGAAP